MIHIRYAARRQCGAPKLSFLIHGRINSKAAAMNSRRHYVRARARVYELEGRVRR